MKKYAELHQLSISELENRVAESQKTLSDLKFKHAISPLENPMQIRTVRRNIARLNTIIRAKQSAEQQKN